MSNFKKFPTSVRYLIARLRHWTQPAVWAPLAVLCAGGLFIWEVSVNPERLSIDGEAAADSNNPDSISGLSAEDSAIAAEIDSLPVLVNQFNESNSELNLFNSSAIKSKGLFEEIRDRKLTISRQFSAPKQAAISRFLSLPNLQNSAVGTVNNNPQNSNLPSSNATSDLSLSGSGATISGIKTIAPESAGTEATLPEASGSGNSGKQNDNPLALSPLQAAMKKYIAANTSATAAVKSANSAKLLDRPPSPDSPTNPTNFLPTAATTQAGANPVNFPATLSPLAAPTNTIISDSQQFLNPAATVPESLAGLNSRVSVISTITPQTPTVVLPKNPYQTNLSDSGFAPSVQPVAVPVATPSPIPLIPNFGQSPGIGGSKIISPQFSPNSANAQFQQPQPSRLNLPGQPNFGAVPQNTNQNAQPIQPQPFSTPRSLTPGRYIGGGEINTFANP
ncbi:hypothetical protein QUB60_05085 [Microcoleus sp. A2-C5]|uniref:hypothetical protein n=1 Tax=Microcoleaceae TaxID=1892252 RepID=UPI0022384518|nr:hypothetical protein [Lyngbya sp. CCAP 1446/10]MCW6049010.1 hypothetical protein [Lyngbya sp. CCAP 1446/10]